MPVSVVAVLRSRREYPGAAADGSNADDTALHLSLPEGALTCAGTRREEYVVFGLRRRTAETANPAAAATAAALALRSGGEAAESTANAESNAARLRIGVASGRIPATASAAVLAANDPLLDPELKAIASLASRLAKACPPDGILVCHETYRAIVDELEAIPQAPLPAGPAPAGILSYLVSGQRRRLSRAPLMNVLGGETVMLGREDQLAFLWDCFQQARRRRRPTLVTVVGDTGSGKRRLVFELLRLLERQSEPPIVLRVAAEEDGVDEPLALVAMLLRAAARIHDDEAGERAEQKLAAWASEMATSRRSRGRRADDPPPPLAAAMAFPADAAHVLRDLAVSPEGHGSMHDLSLLAAAGLPRRASDLLAALLSRRARRGVIVLVLESLHWADAVSLKVVEDLLAGCGDHPVLAVATARPAFQRRAPNWGSAVSSTALVTLAATARDTASEHAEHLLRAVRGVPAEAVERIVTASAEVPGAAEELVRQLADRGVLVETSEGWRWDGDSGAKLPDRTPPTSPPAASGGTDAEEWDGGAHCRADGESAPGTGGLAALLDARLRGLPGEAHAVLTAAAAFGSWFTDGAVVAALASELQPEQVREALDFLVSREMLRAVPGTSQAGSEGESDQPGGATFAFASSAGSEAARRAARERPAPAERSAATARWLLEHLAPGAPLRSQRARAQLAAAGDLVAAARCDLEAADDMRRRGALDESMAACARAGAALTAGAAGADDARRRECTALRARAALAYARCATALGRSAEAAETLDQAERYAAELDAVEPRCEVELARAGLCASTGAFDSALDHAEAALALACESDQRSLLLRAEAEVGLVHSRRGYFRESITHLAKAAVVAEEVGDAEWMAALLLALGDRHVILGHAEDALESFARAASTASASALPEAQALALLGSAAARLLKGEHDRAECDFAAAADRAHALAMRAQHALACVGLGQVAMATGRTAKAEQDARLALQEAQDCGATVIAAGAYRLLGMALAAPAASAPGATAPTSGATAPREALEQSIALLEKTSARNELAESQVALGQLLLGTGADAEGRRWFERGIANFRELGLTRKLVALGLASHQTTAWPALASGDSVDLAMPDRVGPYEILEVIGTGAMGVVYRARHVRTGRSAALKTVRAADAGLLATLRREIHALSRLRHPGIVRVVDHGVHEGRPWYAMDLIDGASITAHCRSLWPLATRPTVLPEAVLRAILSVFYRLSTALAYLHGEGVVHRDLTPNNVLVCSGQPVIVDLGLTTRLSTDDVAAGARSRELLEIAPRGGTLAYMAPEQIRGAQVDPRADLYALGCMLYEVLTGNPPYVGAHGEVAMGHLRGTPKALGEQLDGIPEALEMLLRRLLAKAPQDRLGYADDVARFCRELGADAEEIRALPPARPYVYRPRFVGRQKLLEQVQSALQGLPQGHGAAVFIGGESGVGKTRFCVELAQEASTRGARVVAAPCDPEHRFTSLGPFRQLLLAVTDACRSGGAEVTRRLLGAHGQELARFHPELADVLGTEVLAVAGAQDPEQARKRACRQFEHIVAALAAERPILLLVDDLQWADGLSLDVIRHLTAPGRLDAHPVAVVATYRSEDAGSDELRAVLGAEHVMRITLGRLAEGDIADMVAGMLALRSVPPELATALTRHSEGNPFFVTEYVLAGVESGLLKRDENGRWRVPGSEVTAGRPRDEVTVAATALPRSLRDVVRKRLQGLGQGATALARAAAVLGRESRLELAGKVSRMAEPQVIAALDELVRRSVLTLSDGGGLRFEHDKIREVLYEDIASDELPVFHRRAATLLESAPGGSDESEAGMLGEHWHKGGELDRARSCYLTAARTARKRHETLVAARFFRLYLSLITIPTPESARVHDELARTVLNSLGQLDEAFEHHRTAFREADARGDNDLTVKALTGMSFVGYLKSDRPATMRYAVNAAERVTEQTSPAARAAVEKALGIAHGSSGSYREAITHYQASLELERELGNLTAMGSNVNNIAVNYWLLHELDRAMETFEEGRRLFEEAGDVCGSALALRNQGSILFDRGDLERAVAVSVQARDLFERGGDYLQVGWTIAGIADMYQQWARFQEAAQWCREGLTKAREYGDLSLEAELLALLARIERRSGSYPAVARRFAEAAEQACRQAADELLMARCLAELGHVALWCGEPADALLRRAEEAAAKLGVTAETRDESDSGAPLRTLKRAIAAAAGGGVLCRGECPEDLPERQRPTAGS
ncbi:MAG: AAA family ATPase [Candidatus Schekmanbacteria bacterium]|nr:AAA family ATPase [Candidatus Schekmanbacteria bacterium]